LRTGENSIPGVPRGTLSIWTGDFSPAVEQKTMKCKVDKPNVFAGSTLQENLEIPTHPMINGTKPALEALAANARRLEDSR